MGSRGGFRIQIDQELGAPYDLVVECHKTGKLPVPNFSGCLEIFFSIA